MKLDSYNVKRSETRLSIFETLKTRSGQLSTRARRQRAIMCVLAQHSNPNERTRIAIAKRIAGPTESKWQTAYPGVFKDIKDIMLPTGVIKEEGRLPMRRGPKALQSQGNPYYGLTVKGTMVALAISEMPGRSGMLNTFLESELSEAGTLIAIAESSPELVYISIQQHVENWCRGEADLDSSRLEKLPKDSLLVACCGLLESFMNMSRERQEAMVEFLSRAKNMSVSGTHTGRQKSQ